MLDHLRMVDSRRAVIEFWWSIWRSILCLRLKVIASRFCCLQCERKRASRITHGQRQINGHGHLMVHGWFVDVSWMVDHVSCCYSFDMAQEVFRRWSSRQVGAERHLGWSPPIMLPIETGRSFSGRNLMGKEEELKVWKIEVMTELCKI